MSAQIIAAIPKQNNNCTKDQISNKATVVFEDNWPLITSEDDVLKTISNTAYTSNRIKLMDKTDNWPHVSPTIYTGLSFWNIQKLSRP